MGRVSSRCGSLVPAVPQQVSALVGGRQIKPEVDLALDQVCRVHQAAGWPRQTDRPSCAQLIELPLIMHLLLLMRKHLLVLLDLRHLALHRHLLILRRGQLAVVPVFDSARGRRMSCRAMRRPSSVRKLRLLTITSKPLIGSCRNLSSIAT